MHGSAAGEDKQNPPGGPSLRKREGRGRRGEHGVRDPVFCVPPPLPSPKRFRPRTVPRILSGPLRGLEDHLSIAAHSALPPEGGGRAIHRATLALLQAGACPAAPVARRAVRSYRTFSPLPLRAVCSLWRCPSTEDLASASRFMLRSYNAAKFEPAPCPVKFGSSSPPLRKERPSVRGLKFVWGSGLES